MDARSCRGLRNGPHRDLARGIVIAAAIMGGCATAPPPVAPVPASLPRPETPAPAPRPASPDARTESDWRQAAAKHILEVNSERVFEGRPPHPLKAVVVLDLTVGADGRLQRATVLRAPGHARQLGNEAIRSVQAASPLPPPPRALLAGGVVRFTETWLYRQDDRFQLRTLAQTQLLD